MKVLKYADDICQQAEWSFQTANFFVGLYIEEEDEDPEDSFDREEDIEFARSGADGAWFCAVVRVFLKDDTSLRWAALGSDYLGGCSYRSVKEFYTSHRDPDDNYRNTLAMKDSNRVICHAFPDMVREAVSAARTELKRVGCVAVTMRK